LVFENSRIIFSLKTEKFHLTDVTNKASAVPNSPEGYSLVELSIVIACIAILLSAAVPNITHLHQIWSLWGSARVLEASLQWGRMHAIMANTPLLFEVDDSRRKFHWVDPATGNPYESSVRHLSRGIRISKCPKRPLRFYQQGNAAPAGTYVLENQAGSYSVVVTPGGRIRFQKN
jgi:prepilin-type N-terminal cleavage/methylation domain-containing protein